MAQYLMQGVSSESGELVLWLSPDLPDFAGAAFPGPGIASEIAVAAINGSASGGGGGGGGDPSDAVPQPIGTPGAGTSDLYSRADHVHGMPTAAAHSLLTTGSSSGRVESVVTLGEHSVLGRSTANLVGFTLSENEILGRATGGTLGGTSPQSFVFAGGLGNPTLRVAPDSSAPITSLDDSSQRNFIYSFADGFYNVTISVLAKEGSGEYHDAGALLGVVSDSGELTIVRATPLPGSEGLTLDFDVDEDDLVVTLGNETGDAITGRLHVGWMRQDLIP